MKTAHNVKLLNGSKQEVTYPGVETVTMPGTDGQDKVFTAGAPIDALDISPDFSGGDMSLEAPEGYVVRSATIKKPEGAEQVIAKGQTLAGISGVYVTPGTAKEIILDFSAGSETDYLPQLTGTTALDNTYGYFIRVKGGTPLTVGDTYLVSWDGTVYTCIAQDASILMEGAVCLGNATALGLSGDDEPFCAAYLQGGFSVVALTDTEPTEHTVRIYQVSEDQTVTAEVDERWSEVTVKKPDGLVPENIPKGVEIAGVVGKHKDFTLVEPERYAYSNISYFESDVGLVAGSAFASCADLSAVSLPHCKYIDASAFYFCQNLTSVYAPNCEFVGNGAFAGCNKISFVSFPKLTELRYANIPDCVTDVTVGCKFDPVTGDYYTEIYSIPAIPSASQIKQVYENSLVGANAFYVARPGSSTVAAVLGLSGKYVSASITIPYSDFDARIQMMAFYNCMMLQSLTIHGTVQNRYFTRTEWSSAGQPDIGYAAFQGCSKLQELKILLGSTIRVSNNAFYNCQKLSKLYLIPQGLERSLAITSLTASVFMNTPMSKSSYLGYYGSIYAPTSIVDIMKTRPGWSWYSARMVSLTDEETENLITELSYGPEEST